MKNMTRTFLVLVAALLLNGCNSTGTSSDTDNGLSTTPNSPSSNRAPIISGNPPVSVMAGQAYSFTPNATDADGDALTFSISNVPTWASFNVADGTLHGTPLSSDIGIYNSILISVSDASHSVSLAKFSITVSGSQQTGKLINFSNNALTVNEGAIATATVTRSDSSGVTSVLYGTHGVTAVSSTANGDDYQGFDPTLLTFADGETTKLISVQTLDNNQQESTETFEIILTSPSDGYELGVNSVATVTITDNDDTQNQPPSIRGTPATDVTMDNTYSFTPSASDPDGDSLSFSISNQPDWATFNTTTGTLSGTPGVTSVGAYTDIVISVTDGNQSASLPAFNISVTENNHIPLAQADTVSVNQNTNINIDVLANDSGMEDGLTSVILTSKATHGNLQVNADNTIQYIPDIDFYGSDNFTYQITDVDGDSDSAMVSISIKCVTNCVVDGAENTLYVRRGATGNNSGSDWGNAFTKLPDVLERGTTYLIADGNYQNYNFNDPVSGVEQIYIHKATASDHGTDTGWVDSYGDGQSVFGTLNFSTGYYVFDGIVDYGFKALGSYQGLVVNIQASHVQIRHTDIDGNFELTNGYQTNGACTGLNITGTDVTVQYSDIHNIADDAVTVYDSDLVNIIKSKVHNLHACGTDNGCGPCYNGHSDGFELNNTSNLTISANLVYDIKSTAALFTGNWSPTYLRNLTLTNNIFYTPETGLTVYLQYIHGANVYNNIIWGLLQGSRFGGLSIGPEVTGLNLKNNIILSMNFSHTGGVYNATEQDIDYNIYGTLNASEYNLNTHEIIADPQFNNIPLSSDINQHILGGLDISDFMLSQDSPAIDRGYNLPGVVDTDILDNSRPQDGNSDGLLNWDIGPFELSP
jgi:hypothetical protein